MAFDSHTYKVLNRFSGKALHHYNMISDGDRIVVGLSGGKDSLTLMWILKERLSRIPLHYDLFAVYIDPG
ncbi:MAG: tRNA 2-thiocytidine(32) synthetase TtcA, partial [Deltaproteobacteria bacterium]|nr:tRNA 2-thiocytidine(32) synthetase TtcA [Deltaproteobacteria bacterium]